MRKQVLIVDDDTDILTMLEYALKKTDKYDITLASGSIDALGKFEKEPFDLIICDYMMKGITGVDLARAVRRIAPGTPVVLMSAYGTKRLRETTQFLGLEGFVDKPFSVDKIRNIVDQILSETSGSEPRSQAKSQAFNKAVRQSVQELMVSTNARCVLLVGSDGYPVQVVGQVNDLRISNISALIAGNFMGASELASLLGNQASFKSSFHEGDGYNIYIQDVNGSFLLGVVFDAKKPPGAVWFYTKQTAIELDKLLHEFSHPIPGQ